LTSVALRPQALSAVEGTQIPNPKKKKHNKDKDKDNPNKNQLAKQKFGSAGELESDSGVCLEEKSGS
jgi:hypothetical protein